MKSIRLRKLMYTALSAALIAVCAQISIPFAVPFTMQTFAVFLVAGILGPKWGAAAVVLYMGMGAVGLPVFAGFRGGIQTLLGPTGGYISGFIVAAVIAGAVPGRYAGSFVARLLAMTAALVALYLIGTAWFVYSYTGEGGITFSAALKLCVWPFVVPDLAKAGLAAVSVRRLRRALKL